MTQARARRMTSWMAVAVITLGVLGSAWSDAVAQQRPAEQGPPPGRGGMMGDRQAMMATMQAQEKKLDTLVAAMNAAGGSDKADRVAAVVTELVAQHKAMHARMMTMMQGGMMGGPRTAPTPAGPAGPAGPATPASPSEHDQHH